MSGLRVVRLLILIGFTFSSVSLFAKKLDTGYASMDEKLAAIAKVSNIKEAGFSKEEKMDQLAEGRAMEAILESDVKERDLVVPQKLALGRFSLTSPDINVFLKTRLREEYITLNSSVTFRHDYSDNLDMIRQKFSLYLYAIQGLQKYGKASTEFFAKLTSYNFWQNDSYYVHMTEEDIYMHNREPDKEVRFMDDHKHGMLVPLIFLEDVWFNIHFGTFNKRLNKNPVDLKMGYFEYILGRGLTLGNYYDIGLEHLGWRGQGGAVRFPQSPPGALFRMRLFDTTTFDIYYSQWSETNCFPTQPRRMLHTQLLKDRGDNNSEFDTGNTGRGKTNDQQSWSARINYEKETNKMGKLYVQPYAMWTRAPEQGIELKADASSRFGTLGAMVDWQKSGWRFNVEGAFQFGRQNVHAIDRNVIETERDSITGDVKEVYSNIYYSPLQDYGIADQTGPYYGSSKAPVTKDLADVINSADNMGVNKNGQRIIGGMTVVPSGLAGGYETFDQRYAYNSKLLGQERFREPFKLNYEGFMALADLSYDWEKLHLKPAVMAGYISGDNYPYNSVEGQQYKNRNYTGFLTLRDQNYMGLEVLSYAMLEARFMPRPLNLSYHKGYAYNHYNDASNLGMLGAGLIWHPYKEKEKLFFQFNAIGFWSAKSMYKWDDDGYAPFNSAPLEILSGDNTVVVPVINMTQRGFHQQVVKQGEELVHVTGWNSSTEKASSYLGTELNARIEMHFQDSLEFLIRGSIFLNGSTYNDLWGQPNRNTRRVDYKGNKFYESLGTSNAWGVHSSLTYRF